MKKKLDKALPAAVLRLMRPLVRILLRNGMAYGTLAELVRKVYVDVAYREFAPEGKKQTVSRVSALTGLTRKEVRRLLDDGMSAAAPGQERYNRAIRVISGWVNDRRFLGSNGKPADLPVEGVRKSFALLVKDYSGDIPTQAMLSMLEEAGSIRLVKGKVRLIRHAYVPSGDAAEKIEILGSDVFELVSTIDYNLSAETDDLRFQRKVSYDNIDPEALDKLKKMSFSSAQALLEKLDKHYSASELKEGTGKKRGKYISLGIYYHEQDPSEE
jgi:hypothetical protein